MQALILAGGKGTRISHLYPHIPKPMISVNHKPVLQHQIELLKKHYITDIKISVKHISHVIKDYFKDGKEYGVNITYIEEKGKFLGTGGVIKEFEKELDEQFLVLYGDMYFTIDLDRLRDFHDRSNSLGSILAVTDEVCDPQDCDLLEVDEHNHITGIIKKPHNIFSTEQHFANYAVYVFNKQMCEYITKGKFQDIAQDIFPKVIEDQPHALRAYITDEYIKDIGTPERLQQARADIRTQREELFHYV
jgi:NDP-sugar pyrophosphorylase family protein